MINLRGGGRTLGAVLRKGFGVKAITPTDPGIIRLARTRSGKYTKYAGSPTFNITPASEANQLLGLTADPIQAYARAYDENPFLNQTLPKILLAVNSTIGGGFASFGAGLAKQAEQSAIRGAFVPTGGAMAFEDGDSGFSFPTFGDIGQVFQGQLGRDLLGIGTQALSGYVQGQFGQPTAAPVANMAVVAGGARAVAMIGRSFFNRFPALATAIQSLRNRGANVTRGQLWSLMKRFGGDFLISGGILTAAAVSELAIAGPGRRRMNPGNVKALRKAHRRMKSFHRVCQMNDHLLGAGGRRRKRPLAVGATNITRVS